MAVSKQQGTIRMETLPKSISTSLPEKGNAQNRFVCINTVSPNTPVLCIKTRPFQSEDRYPTAELGQSIPLCISPILPYSTSLIESELRPNRKNVACYTNLTVSYLVPPSTRNAYSSSTATSKERKLSKPTGGVHSLIAKRALRLPVWTISGKDYLRREFQKQLPNLLQVQDKKVHNQITVSPGECWLAGVINNRLMHFDMM